MNCLMEMTRGEVGEPGSEFDVGSLPASLGYWFSSWPSVVHLKRTLLGSRRQELVLTQNDGGGWG